MKMQVELDSPVKYQLPIGDQLLDMNERIGSTIKLEYNGQINCIKCGTQTKKSFGQGFCYPCFRSAPEASECVLRPELCRAHEGEARDMEWAKRNCLQEHIVYLAKSSVIKVGITRGEQVPTRWLDQGASEAVILAKTPNRYTAGLVEVALKEFLTDRTNWRRMLKNEVIDESLSDKKLEVIDKLDDTLREYIHTDDELCVINYPVERYPDKVKSVGFDKLEVVEGKLLGIKGQYLLLDEDRVLNIRKHQGYTVTVT